MAEITQVSQKQGVSVAKLCVGLALPRASYYRHQVTKTRLLTQRKACANALPENQRKTILDLLHSERFADDTPYQIYYTLLDEGRYYCSVRTLYRLLDEQGEVRERRDQRSHRDAVKPELMAVRQNQVWSWDITKLLSTERLTYYYLYVIIDIFSRYVVGWMIADRECQFLAHDLIQKSTLRQGIQRDQLTLHSDNGPSMVSHTVAQLLEHLGVLKTHNRPYTSNDNPFSESQFKTLKYCPQFPKRFGSLEEAEKFSQTFFAWYNQKHYHSGILWLTPETVHYNQADSILEKRHQILLNAYNKNPARFNKRMPAIKKLGPVYINPPQNLTDKIDLQREVNMA